MRHCLTYGLSFPRNHACIKGYRHRRKSGSHYHKRLSCYGLLKSTHAQTFLFFFLKLNVSVDGTQMNTLHWTVFSLCIQVSLATSNSNLPIQKSPILLGQLWWSFPSSINPLVKVCSGTVSWISQNNQFGVPALDCRPECSGYRTLKSCRGLEEVSIHSREVNCIMTRIWTFESGSPGITLALLPASVSPWQN